MKSRLAMLVRRVRNRGKQQGSNTPAEQEQRRQAAVNATITAVNSVI